MNYPKVSRNSNIVNIKVSRTESFDIYMNSMRGIGVNDLSFVESFVNRAVGLEQKFIKLDSCSNDRDNVGLLVDENSNFDLINRCFSKDTLIFINIPIIITTKARSRIRSIESNLEGFTIVHIKSDIFDFIKLNRLEATRIYNLLPVCLHAKLYGLKTIGVADEFNSFFIKDSKYFSYFHSSDFKFFNDIFDAFGIELFLPFVGVIQTANKIDLFKPALRLIPDELLYLKEALKREASSIFASKKDYEEGVYANCDSDSVVEEAKTNEEVS